MDKLKKLFHKSKEEPGGLISDELFDNCVVDKLLWAFSNKLYLRNTRCDFKMLPGKEGVFEYGYVDINSQSSLRYMPEYAEDDDGMTEESFSELWMYFSEGAYMGYYFYDSDVWEFSYAFMDTWGKMKFSDLNGMFGDLMDPDVENGFDWKKLVENVSGTEVCYLLKSKYLANFYRFINENSHGKKLEKDLKKAEKEIELYLSCLERYSAIGTYIDSDNGILNLSKAVSKDGGHLSATYHLFFTDSEIINYGGSDYAPSPAFCIALVQIEKILLQMNERYHFMELYQEKERKGHTDDIVGKSKEVA